MIFYFTGTGNSKYVADRLGAMTGEPVVSIADAQKQGRPAFDARDQAVGFVLPIYFYGIPTIVADFVRGMELQLDKGAYVYAVFTCGKSTGAAGDAFAILLQEREIHLCGMCGIQMPDNYIPLLNPPDETEEKRILKKADAAIDKIYEQVRSRYTGDMILCRGAAPKLVSKMMYPFYERGRKTRKFYADQNCNGCGLCESVCPANVIRMKDNKPEWTAPQCVFCMGCINRCPRHAIQYGALTKKRNRFVNEKAGL